MVKYELLLMMFVSMMRKEWKTKRDSVWAFRRLAVWPFGRLTV
jgi:hypothetical protein